MRSTSINLHLSVWFLAPLSLLTASCNEQPPQEGNSAAQKNQIAPRLEGDKISQHCYLHTNNRDSIALTFSRNGDDVEGTLYFNNYQIDDSKGTIAGRFHGDTLFVLYSFFAEGTHSMMDEAFLMKGDSLIRGIGNHVQMAEKLQYNDKDGIDFGKGQIFQKVLCGN